MNVPHRILAHRLLLVVFVILLVVSVPSSVTCDLKEPGVAPHPDVRMFLLLELKGFMCAVAPWQRVVNYEWKQ